MTEVILLLFIAIVLIVLNVNAIKKQKKSFSGALKDKESSMQDYEIEIGRLRRDLSETVLELQQEIEALKVARENDNFKEVSHRDNLEDKEFYKNLYERNSHNDEIEINKDLKSEEARQQLEEVVMKEIELEQNGELNEKDKNEFEHKSINVVESVSEKDDEKKINNKLNNHDVVDENNKSYEISKSNENNKGNQNNIKVTEIKTMLDEGLSIDEISEKIGIGKGEVLLIKELYLK
ncbi:hypothetical protein [Clostridium magnum]|uniref:Uncharacterized protein n=1 Tax=Clostridium magnum DSM 2767 TaxID=1121326 RepID=A0A161XHK9_9CLOT|nr:hypothetical protein [Clostridium magnum]KZL94156.1 hypothetical protein CLMAG_12090 [Clostridium magnum DSM 2767]SHH94036.1 hypothetical protein SAMN02745944_01844 [Clostridium magnum DSM 2767]